MSDAIDFEFSPDEADLMARALKWAAKSCDYITRAYPSDGTVVFCGQHTRDRCSALAARLQNAIDRAADDGS